MVSVRARGSFQRRRGWAARLSFMRPQRSGGTAQIRLLGNDLGSLLGPSKQCMGNALCEVRLCRLGML